MDAFIPLGSPEHSVLLFFFALTSAAVHAQTRPALIGNGPLALVNLIDTQKLMKKGGQDALVMFSCELPPGTGPAVPAIGATVYRETPGGKALREEVAEKCYKARYLPALYNGHSVPVELRGTVMFSVVDGKPHLRIFANQNPADLTRGSDFVAPQVIVGTQDWEIVKKELSAAAAHMRTGATELSISTDASGKVSGISVVSEDPKGYNFGHAAMEEFQHARFIPAFRDGYPVACTTAYTAYVGIVLQWHTTVRH